MSHDRYWMLGDHVITTNPRAGSATIRQCMTASRGTQLHQGDLLKIKDDVIITFALKHPFSRLASCWHLMTKGGWDNKGISTNTFNDFCNQVVRSSNIHWNPQCMSQWHAGRWLPQFTNRLETINDWWHEAMPGAEPVMHLNHDPERRTWDELRRELQPRTLELIRMYYDEDRTLWETCR